jgi:hypothetical protein
MAENPHYGELVHLLNEFEVEYRIVGGFAVMKHGRPLSCPEANGCSNNEGELNRVATSRTHSSSPNLFYRWPVGSRGFNPAVAFFTGPKSLQLIDPLGDISPVPL